MAADEKIKAALKKGRKLHTHQVTYKRADNGGLHAHVERHTKQGHHHTEHHVLANKNDAAQHLLEHMSDQPEIGAGAPPEVAPPEASEGEGAMGADAAGGATGAPTGPAAVM